MQNDKIVEYCTTVCSQILWKKSHKKIFSELQNHLLEQRDAFVEMGDSIQEATDKAILDFGDPVCIGMDLDRVHRPKSQYPLMILLVLFCLFGGLLQFFCIQSTSAIADMIPQAVSYLIGFAILMAAYFIDFSILSRYSLPIAICTLAVVLIACIPSSGRHLKYYIVWLYPIAVSCAIYYFRTKGYAGLTASTLFLLLLIICSLFTNRIMGVFLCLFSGLVLLPLSVFKGWFHVRKIYGFMICMTPCLLLLLTACAVYLSGAGRTGDEYISGLLQEIVQNASWLGMGRTLSSPFPSMFHTDYILAYLLYRHGWIPLVTVIALLYSFVAVCIWSAARQKSMFGKLIAVSIAGVFAIQITVYALSNLGVIRPYVSTILPFISYGSFANIINFALLGLLLSIFRNGEVMDDRVAKPILTRAGWKRIRAIIHYEETNGQ